MSEFSCGKYNYRMGVIDARSQFHIVRRMAPFLKGMVPVVASMTKSGAFKKGGVDPVAAEKSKDEVIAALPAIADVLAAMTDEDADYVIFGLLAAVSRKQDQGLGWAPVSRDRQLMFQDITMPEMLTMAGRVLVANLGSFFNVLNSISSQVGPTPNDQ